MKILFGIMSAVQPAATAAALCDALGRDHPILIHHDFSQQADFSVVRPNVDFVPDPKRTGWANWGFTEGILKLLETALKRSDWDYFQLLSPVCLPVRPVAEFARFLEESGVDYLASAVRITDHPNYLVSHGWRAYSPENTLRHRVLRRARRWYLGPNPVFSNKHGLSYPETSMIGSGGLAGLKARIGLAITEMAKRGIGFPHVFGPDNPCHAGSTWFTASREACQLMLTRAADPETLRFISRMHMADEMFFPTVLRNSPLRGRESEHYISHFQEARPAWIGLDDLDTIFASGKFFARKFPEDVESPVRVAVTQRLARASTRSRAPDSREVGNGLPSAMENAA
jgi:hypothetical protein